MMLLLCKADRNPTVIRLIASFTSTETRLSKRTRLMLSWEPGRFAAPDFRVVEWTSWKSALSTDTDACLAWRRSHGADRAHTAAPHAEGQRSEGWDGGGA